MESSAGEANTVAADGGWNLVRVTPEPSQPLAENGQSLFAIVRHTRISSVVPMKANRALTDLDHLFKNPCIARPAGAGHCEHCKEHRK